MLVEEPEQIGSVQFNLKIKNDSTNQACQYVFCLNTNGGKSNNKYIY